MIATLLLVAAPAGTWMAFTEPERTLELATPEAGLIASIAVEEGDRVAAGQTLATLESSQLTATLAIARQRAAATADLRAAKIELEVKRRRLASLRTLKDNGSREELTRAAADVALAETAVARAEQAIELERLEVARIEAQLARRTLVSPVPGVVSEVTREPGELVPAGGGHVVTVVALQTLEAVFHVASESAATLSVGDGVTVRVDEADVPARVTFIAPLTHAESGTVRVRVAIDNAGGAVRAGAPAALTLVGEGNWISAKPQPRRRTQTAGLPMPSRRVR